MISKRFSTSKKASKFSKRVLGMESLENRELLSINPLGYDGSDVVQTNQIFAESSDVGTEASTLVPGTAGDQQITTTYTPDAAGTYTIKVFTGGASGTEVTSSVTVTDPGNGTAAQDTPVTITVSGLTNDTAYTVVVNDGTTSYDVTMTPKAPVTPGAEGEIAVKGGTVVTGMTTNAATVTLPKVKNAKTYTLYNGGTKIYEGTKNQFVMTGLDAEETCTLTATFQNKDGKFLKLDGTLADNQTAPGDPIDLGQFTTFGEGDAAQVTNPAINGGIAASYAAPGKGKDIDGKAITGASIKVTWKAPANYTGGYTITITDSDGKTASKTIPAGSKAEAYLSAADSSDGFTVAETAFYTVSVEADAANIVSSPPVVVATGKNKIENYDDVKVDAPTAADTVAVTNSATADFGLDVTVTPNATPGTTVGYWVVLYTGTKPSSIADSSNIAVMAYVSGSGTEALKVAFGGLDSAETYKAIVWAANANGVLGTTGTEDSTGKAPTSTKLTGTIAAVDKTYAGTLKATAVSGTASSTKVTWANTKPEADTNKILGWQVSYSTDGGENWILASQVGADAKEYTFTGLNQVGVIYQFKVQAVVEDGTTATNGGFDKGATVKNTKANITKLDKVKKVELDAASATGIKAKWEAVSGASGYIVTVMDGKGIAWQGAVSGLTFDTAADAGLKLVPGVKYDINVDAVQYNGDVVNAGKSKGSFTTVKFSDPTLKVKAGEKAGLTSVNLDLTDKVTAPTGVTRTYIVEYTYVANAKGKADWDAASTATVTGTSAALTGLKAGTQYYARVVAYVGNVDNADIAVIGKEFKFKTVAAPLPTISKSGYSLVNGTDLGFTFNGKFVDDKGKLLQDSTKIFYQLIVSSDSVVDKTTGKLANGVEFGDAAELVAYTETEVAANSKLKGLYKNIDATLTGADGVFDKLNAGDLNTANFKQLNFQLLVYYTTTDSTTGVYATAYTKVAKLAMPKWFV